MSDPFFEKTECERCGGSLAVRIMSWFTTESICIPCSEKEEAIKKALRDRGDDTACEGCGFIPTVV